MISYLSKFYNNPINSDKYRIYNFKEGLACAAKFLYDDNWYRAKILKIYEKGKLFTLKKASNYIIIKFFCLINIPNKRLNYKFNFKR